MFSNRSPDTIKEFLTNFKRDDYARSGFVATETIMIPEGRLMRGEEIVPHNMEPHLRKLGMPTVLINGIVHLERDYTICKEGDVLTPEQAQLLVSLNSFFYFVFLYIVCIFVSIQYLYQI